MECPKCHSDNAADSLYCRSCGSSLSPPGPSPPGDAPQGDTSFRQAEPAPTVIVKLAVGSTFAGRYRITQHLGRGGMGVVYKAEDVRLKRPVALKFLPLELTWNAAAKERFVHEAQAASALDHPNICTIYEVDQTPDGQMFITMALCEGESLNKRIERGPLVLEEALDIAIRLCEGLAAAHSAGMIHRDIKPANIMVKDAKYVRIVDFGLAKLTGQTQLTMAGMVLGTADYMAPEQARGDKVDGRADIWAVGVVLYEMLAGRAPFRGGNQQAVIHSILHSVPEPVEELRSGIPPELGVVVGRCLRKKPAERYQTAAELQADLELIRGSTASTSSVSGSVRAERRLRGGRPLIRGRARKVGLGFLPVILTVALLSMLPPSRPVLDTKVVKQWLGMSLVPRARYVAILPFDLSGGSPRERALCDGLVEVTTSKLARIAPLTHSLWVVPSTDVSKDSVTTADQARTKLKVNLVVTGRVQFSGDVIKLEADLVDTTTLRPLKHFALSDPMANLSTWQDSLILMVTTALDVNLKPERYAFLKIGCTTVPDAFRSYLYGRGCLSPFRHDKSQPDSAIVAFKRAIAQDASFAQAYVGLGEAYMQKKLDTRDAAWLDSAAAVCERATRINDQLPAAFYLEGAIENERHSYDEAIRDFGRAIQLNPKDARPYEGMGMAYSEKAKYDSLTTRKIATYDSAAAAYRNAIRLQPKYYRTYFSLADVYLAQANYEKAAKTFQAMVDLRPDKVTGYTGLGVTYFNDKRWPKAQKAFEQSLRVKPQYDAYSNLGTIYFFDARYADAAGMYEKALKLPRANYQLWGNYAECCHWTPSLRDSSRWLFEKAIAMALDTLRVNPGSLRILVDLASYCSMIGDRNRAEAYLELPVRRDPSDENITFRIAETYEQIGQREAALIWVEKSLERGYPLEWIERYAGMKDLRSDERFAEIRKRAHR